MHDVDAMEILETICSVVDLGANWFLRNVVAAERKTIHIPVGVDRRGVLLCSMPQHRGSVSAGGPRSAKLRSRTT